MTCLREPLLLIYAGVNSNNPTTPTVIDGLGNLPNSEVVGLNVLDVSIVEIHEAIRKHQLIIVDQSVLRGRVIRGGVKHFYRYSKYVPTSTYVDIVNCLLSSRATLALLAIDYDIHFSLGGGLDEDEIARFDIIIWQYVDPPKARVEVSAKYFDPWMMRDLDPLANWKWITGHIPIQVEYTHVLSNREINWDKKRVQWDVCIPGVRYSTREIALATAKEAHMSVAPIQFCDKAIRIPTKLLAHGTLANAAQDARFRMRNLNMRQMIMRSKANYTCGSGYEHLVRKYFEIPALGRPLLAYPLPQLERMGFKDGLNYVATMPEDFSDNADFLLRDEANSLKLARNGLEMVTRFHTQQIRSSDLINVLSSIYQGSSRYGLFQDGRLRGCP